MPVYRCREYAVACDNGECERQNITDYEVFVDQREAEKAWRKRGWKKQDKRWICPDCN